MILTGPEISYALEHAEASHLRRQVETYCQLTHRKSARAIAVSGGIAAVTETVFGRKLNHVTGLGMGAPVGKQAVEELEQAYAELDLDVEIDLCPHADSTALAVLAERGYGVRAFSNTYVRRLADSDADAVLPDSIEIVEERGQVEGVFVPHSIAGFAVQAVPRPAILLETLARIAVARADTVLFMARQDGEIAGTAGMSVIDTPAGPIAHLYIASTLPAYRGRGVQLALLRARLSAARRAGCVMASVTARPANTSARNTERAGFRLAYTKSTLVRRHRNRAIG
jgi:GNAT superfamily N-acetyltransferase